MSALPPGYKLDKGALPPGFTLDQPPEQERGNIADAAMQGLTFGTSDEINGAIRGIGNLLQGKSYGEGYQQGRDQVRADVEGYRKAHPWLATGAEVAGSLPWAVVPVGAVARGASLGSKMLTSGMVGAGMGGAYGAGATDGGLTERLVGGGKGAAFGGGVGAAAPAAGVVLGKAVSAARTAMVPGPVSSRAAGQIADDLAAEGQTVPDVVARRQALGPNGMLADTSETLRLRAEQIAQSDNPARAEVITALKDRSAGARDRIGSAYDASMGPSPNVHAELTKMQAEMKANADALYSQARAENAPVDVSSVIAKIDELTLSPVDNVLNPGSRLPADQVDTALAWLRGHLTTGSEQRTGIEKLDRLERRVRAQTTAAFQSGRTDVGNALNEVGKILRTQMKASSKTYATARETYADDTALQEAFDRGRKLFASSEHPDFLAADISGMSLSEREGLKLGARSAVDEAMGQVRNGALKGRQLLNSNFNERKIKSVLGPDAQALIDALGGEQAMAETASQALGNSATSRRMDNPFRSRQQQTTPSEIRSALNLNFGDAAARLGDRLMSGRRANQAADLAKDLAPVLTTSGPQGDVLMQALIDKAGAVRKGRAWGKMADDISTALMGTAGRAAIPPTFDRSGR